MKNTDSKTTNFVVYIRLLKYKTKKEALQRLDGLARHLGRHKNGLISCIAQAEKNPLIYTKLIAAGYAPGQIPEWFLRPQDEEEPQPQTTDPTITISNHSKQVLPVESQTTQTPQRRNFMGMQAYDWEEIRRYLDKNQLRERRVTDRISEDMLAEYEEERWQNYQKKNEYRRKEKEERFNRKIEKELANTLDPWTTLRILLKIPEWRRWYNNQKPQEQTKTFESIIHLCQLRLQDKLARQQVQNYNAMWLQGRFLGKW